MPVRLTQSTAISNCANINARQKADAIRCIHQLEYADAFRSSAKSEICVENEFRLDLQGVIPATATAAARQNLQVQIAGLSVAHADVSGTVQTDDAMNRVGVMRKIKQALFDSLDTGRTYLVTGSAP